MLPVLSISMWSVSDLFPCVRVDIVEEEIVWVVLSLLAIGSLGVVKARSSCLWSSRPSWSISIASWEMCSGFAWKAVWSMDTSRLRFGGGIVFLNSNMSLPYGEVLEVDIFTGAWSCTVSALLPDTRCDTLIEDGKLSWTICLIGVTVRSECCATGLLCHDLNVGSLQRRGAWDSKAQLDISKFAIIDLM